MFEKQRYQNQRNSQDGYCPVVCVGYPNRDKLLLLTLISSSQNNGAVAWAFVLEVEKSINTREVRDEAYRYAFIRTISGAKFPERSATINWIEPTTEPNAGLVLIHSKNCLHHEQRRNATQKTV